MTPYGGRNLLEQQFVRVVIENTFGVLAARWQVLLKTIAVHPKNADKIVLATVILHNFMLSNARRQYMPEDFTDRAEDESVVKGRWREILNGLNSIPSNQRMGARNESLDLRNKIKTLIFNKRHNI